MDPVDEFLQVREKMGLTKLPEPSKETLDAMEYNRKLNIEKYGDPLGYLFDYDNEYSIEDEDTKITDIKEIKDTKSTKIVYKYVKNETF